MAYGGQRIRERTFGVGGNGEAPKQRGNIGIGDEALGVRNALVIQNHPDFEGVEGPSPQAIWVQSMALATDSL